jgi:hypothetical protein
MGKTTTENGELKNVLLKTYKQKNPFSIKMRYSDEKQNRQLLEL